MEIIQVIDQLGLGGAERVCVNITNLLYRNGNSVKLIVLKDQGELFDLLDDGVKVIRLQNKSKFNKYKEFVKHVNAGSVVHVHMRAPYRFVQKAFLFYGGRKPIIFHDHYGKIVVDQKVALFYKLFKPDIYIGVSKLLVDWGVSKMTMDSDKALLVSNIVFKYDVIEQQASSEKKGIVFVGNLKKVKNHIFAIKLAHKLNMDLTIYCGKDEGNTYFKSLKKEIQENYSSQKINFIYDHKNVQSDLNKYDFAVCTSKSESGPLVLLEFLAQEIPFLTYKTGEIANFVEGKLPDFVIDNFVLEDWVKRSELILQKKDNYALMKVFQEYWNRENFIDKYLQIYQKVLNS